MPAACRFPPPWIVEEHNDACFIVKGATGRRSATSISRRSPQRRTALVAPPQQQTAAL